MRRDKQEDGGATLTAAFFGDLRPETIERLDRAAKEVSFRNDEPLIAAGAPPATIFGVLEGRVRVWWTSRDGASHTLLLLGEGELIGALAVVRRAMSSVSASAVTVVRATAWPADAFREALKTDAALAERTLHLVAARVQQVLDRLEELATPLDRRLARVLLRLASEGDGAGSGVLRIDLTRQHLADLVSVTMPTVSRIMSRWRGRGLIGGGRGEVLLPDPAGLARIADGGEPD